MSAPVRLTPSRRRGDRAARPAGSPVLRVGVVLIAVQLLLRGWALSGSWFFFDDLAFMSAGMNDPLDQHFVTRVYAGHVMPGGWLVVKWLATAAPYQWPAWAAVLLGLQAVAGLGMLRLLRSMFGESQLVLALLAGYLFYVFTLPAGLWFAAGINQLPLQVALVFGLHAHLAYLRTRRWQHVAATLAWTAFGLAFYEKAALLFLIYAIVALGWFARGTLAARAGELWSGRRPGILAHGCWACPMSRSASSTASPSGRGTAPARWWPRWPTGWWPSPSAPPRSGAAGLADRLHQRPCQSR
ncbi:MAG: hypothetical protein R2734_10680 [Nocardioides sp.]